MKKFLFKLSLNSTVIKLFEKLYKIVLIIMGVHVADIVLFAVSRLLFSSPGLTFTRYGYYNPYSYKFIWEVQEQHRINAKELNIKEKRIFKKMNASIRVGFFGNLAVPNKSLFENAPCEWEIFYYDIQDSEGYRAAWLEADEKHYYCALLNGSPISISKQRQDWEEYIPIIRENSSPGIELSNLSKRVNCDKLDVIVYIGGISKNWDTLVDLIDVPIIINYATGSIISFNKRVNLDLFSQPQLYYGMSGDHVYCDIMKTEISSVKAKEIRFAFNHRDIKKENNIPWEKRKKQIVFWGNLYKLNNISVLTVISNILHEHNEFEFLFFGPEQQDELNHIFTFFCKQQIGNRVRYLGIFENYANIDGTYSNTSWMSMLETVRASNLFIDAWPICGGNSVFQAYMLGIPCVSMKLIPDENYSVTKNKVSVSVNGLNIGAVTARNLDEYEEMCRKVLNQNEFAQQIINMQYERVANLCNYRTIWDSIEEFVNSQGNI